MTTSEYHLMRVATTRTIWPWRDMHNELSTDDKTDREWKYPFVTHSQVTQAKEYWDAMKALGA